jgi:phage/plasmid-associated DNA primase
MFLLCNKVPEIPSNDGGTWRRLRVSPWEMKFVDNPKQALERKADRELKEKIKTDSWKEALLTYLINHFETMVTGKPIFEPAKVLQYTKLYQDISDVYQNFINDKITFTRNSKDKSSFKILYEEFKTWFNYTRNIRTTVKLAEFKIEMMSKFPHEIVKITGQTIRGVIIKLGDGEVKNVDEKKGKEDDKNIDEESENDDVDDNKIAYV